MDNVPGSNLQPWLRTFRISPLQTTERCCPRKEVESDDDVLSIVRSWLPPGQGKVMVGHTCPHSMLAQSYRTAWRLCRKLGYIYINVQSTLCIFPRFMNKYLARKKCGA